MELVKQCAKCKCVLPVSKFDRNNRNDFKQTCIKCLNIVKQYNKNIRDDIKLKLYNHISKKYDGLKQMFISIGYNCMQRGTGFNDGVSYKSLFLDLLPPKPDKDIHDFYKKYFDIALSSNNKQYRILLIISFNKYTSTFIFGYHYSTFSGYINKSNCIGCDICFDDNKCLGYICDRCKKHVCSNCYENINKDFLKPCPYCNYSFKEHVKLRGCIAFDTYNRYDVVYI